MPRWNRVTIAALTVLCTAGGTYPRSSRPAHEWTEPELEQDVVHDVDGTNPTTQKVLQDTLWIATWPHDTGTACDEMGWTHVDNRIRNDGSNYWHIETGFTTTTGMEGKAAAVGQHGQVCCESPDGYDNAWYQAIRITYTGAASLSLDYKVDSEASFDFLQIETDSACASFARVDFRVNPISRAAAFRAVETLVDGIVLDGELDGFALSDHGAGTHCVYIAFFSDGGFSPCDGYQPTTFGEGAVVDNIVVVDGAGTRSEDFEDGTLDIGTFSNIADSAPFGTWARLYRHITDNDACTENRTCAWLWTDYTTPTLFNDPRMAFGPDGYVVKNWLDDIIMSPWVSLATTPTASGTVIQFRRFPGNFFSNSRIVQSWSVRGKGKVGTHTCYSAWGHASQWNSLSFFGWQTLTFDMSPHFDPAAEAIQIRHRTSDWQWIAGSAVTAFSTGPGPYVDDTRIGRVILSGPVLSTGIDTRSQAQDCFPTQIDPAVTPAGEHHRPTTERFGNCAFSMGADLGSNEAVPHLITGDSIWVQVRGVRPGGETITSVQFCGAIVRGPHAGKAPAPYTPTANGFFCFDADSVRTTVSGAVVPEFYFVDLDDAYFRGGDELHYFWSATDDGGGFSSDPPGLSGMPASVTAAQTATSGLREVSYLPAIRWDAGYLSRIAADAHGDLEPTPAEVAGSRQKNCILVWQASTANRRAGPLNRNRTSFMHTLDRLGYRHPGTLEPAYDIYDQQGLGNTNNHLGGRATIEQAQGYSLIVMEAGNRSPAVILPDGSRPYDKKIDQAGWFRSWLAQAGIGEAGFATLWIIGSNVVQEAHLNALLATAMGVALLAGDQGLNVNPDVIGVAGFAFDRGTTSTTVNWTGDLFRLNGGCPSVRNYDAVETNAATAVVTHRYRNPWTQELGGGAIVMNRNDAEQWNTIMQTHSWFDIRDPAGTPRTASPERVLLSRTLGAVLPITCLAGPFPPDSPWVDTELYLPPRTALHQNVPNPFNPTTQIRFDLAQSGRVQLRIYDVAGRLVRVLVDGEMQAGRDHSVAWNGLDDGGRRVGSGLYFCRLIAAGTQQTRKLVVLQ